jgi:hypothetical protein
MSERSKRRSRSDDGTDAAEPPPGGTAEGMSPTLTPRRACQLSDRAKRVLARAKEEARRHNHVEIAPDHVLLALLALGRSTGAPSMARIAGADPEALRADIERRIGRGAGPVGDRLALSEGCKRVVRLAVEEAERLRHPRVDTDHLLVGLIAEGSALDTGTITALALRGLRMASGVRSAGRYRPPEAVGVVALGTGQAGTRDNVVTLRVTDEDIAAVDALVDVGISRTRSEAAAWLLHAGLEANRALFERARGIAEEVRRLREEAQQLAREHAVEAGAPVDASPSEPEQPAV